MREVSECSNRGGNRDADSSCSCSCSCSGSSSPHECVHSTSLSLFIFHVFPALAAFLFFFVLRKQENIQTRKKIFSHAVTAKAVPSLSKQKHPALPCNFRRKLKTLRYFIRAPQNKYEKGRRKSQVDMLRLPTFGMHAALCCRMQHCDGNVKLKHCIIRGVFHI